MTTTRDHLGSGGGELCMPETVSKMVINHPNCLHKGIADRRPYESKTITAKEFAHCFRFRRLTGDFPKSFPLILYWHSVDTLPEVAGKAVFPFNHLKIGTRISHGTFHLKSISDHSGSAKDPFAPRLVVACHLDRIQTIEQSIVIVSSSQNRNPA